MENRATSDRDLCHPIDLELSGPGLSSRTSEIAFLGQASVSPRSSISTAKECDLEFDYQLLRMRYGLGGDFGGDVKSDERHLFNSIK